MKNRKTIIMLLKAFVIISACVIGYRAFILQSKLDQTRFFALIGIYVICFLLYKYLFYMKDLHEIDHSLAYDNNPDKFIEECDKKILAAKTPSLKQSWIVNKSAGYKYKGDFKNMLSILEDVDVSSLGGFRLVYLNNIAFANFMLGNDEAGFKIIETNKKDFLKSIKRKQNSKDFCLTLALYYIKKKDFDTSRKFIENSSKYSGLLVTVESFEVLEAWIYAETGRKNEAEKILLNAINTSKFKGVKAMAQNVFNTAFY